MIWRNLRTTSYLMCDVCNTNRPIDFDYAPTKEHLSGGGLILLGQWRPGNFMGERCISCHFPPSDGGGEGQSHQLMENVSMGPLRWHQGLGFCLDRGVHSRFNVRICRVEVLKAQKLVLNLNSPFKNWDLFLKEKIQVVIPTTSFLRNYYIVSIQVL